MVSNMGFWRSNSFSVHLFILLVCTINMEFFKAVHIPALLSYLYYLHCVLYVSVCPVFSMCCAKVDASLLYFIARMFFVSYMERSSCLTYVLYGDSPCLLVRIYRRHVCCVVVLVAGVSVRCWLF
jgi:hypothetical protein